MCRCFVPRVEASRASNLSGLSDISDIIGEVLAQGGVDLTAAGLTQEEADKYAARARHKLVIVTFFFCHFLPRCDVRGLQGV